MNNKITQVFFIGIGGIGMSAIARFFKLKGLSVAGYDRTPSALTDTLQKEGINIVFSDDESLIDETFRDMETTLIVYTPAVKEHRQLKYFKENNFNVLKRSQVLGLITESNKAICIAGTHGKTTISTMAAHLFRQSSVGCNAFLGGISRNYKTNFLWDENSRFAIIEADEFDRSFLTLTPHTALVLAVDADHLDIYETKENMVEAFIMFVERIAKNGNFIVKHNLSVQWRLKENLNIFTYSLNDETADFFAENIRQDGAVYLFDLQTPGGIICDLKTGIPGLVNVENAVGACALALVNKVKTDEIRYALPLFKGIARRFDVIIDTPDLVYIDDYAHHPEEIRATLESVRAMYPNHYLTVIFQPHLFTRTHDFYTGFAKSLSLADELILLDIYPAREEPIEGVTSKIIGDLVENIPVRYCAKSEIAKNINVKTSQVVVTMGAGDIDREVDGIKEKLQLK